MAHTLLSDVDILTLQFKNSGLGVMAHTFSRHAGGRGRQILCKSKANLVYIARSRPVRLLNLCLKTKKQKGSLRQEDSKFKADSLGYNETLSLKSLRVEHMVLRPSFPHL